MDTLTIFLTQLILSITVFSFIAKWYVSPWLSGKLLNESLMILIFPHAFRHVGLSFLVPGLVDESLPNQFAFMTAYGDFISGLLALVAIVFLRKGWAYAISLVWVFNVIGLLDLLNALRQADAVPFLHTTWYIPTFWVPILLVTHVMIFSLLLKKR